MDGYPKRDTVFQLLYLISSMRSVRCFLFSLLFMRVLFASTASWFGFIAVFFLYFFTYLPISSLTVGIRLKVREEEEKSNMQCSSLQERKMI